MNFFLTSGDQLLVDTAARTAPENIRPGDIIAFLDWAGAPVVSVHRVFFRYRAGDGSRRFLTKGDGNLWFDASVGTDQIVGKVAALELAGRSPLKLDSGPGFRAGLLIAAYSYFAVLGVRVCEAAAALLQRVLWSRPRRPVLPAGRPCTGACCRLCLGRGFGRT
jgi:hypothetical protein